MAEYQFVFQMCVLNSCVFKVFYDLIERHDDWFHRQFQFLKDELLEFLRENGRQL